MSFVTGLLLVDAPASALNNRGTERDEIYGNKVAVKAIRSGGQMYPYVSAQAFRYWLRETLGKSESKWRNSPVFRESKVAYTDANPIYWWDDDLFGYMRAPGTDAAAKKAREDNSEYKKLTPLDKNSKGEEQSITRISPFRVSTLVSVGPVSIVEDWESMSRFDDFPIPYSNQFYRTTLNGLFSLDLHSTGTFSYRNKTGYRNLDNVRIEIAKQQALQHLEQDKSYRLPTEQRVKRISTLFEGLAMLEGGAKQSLHYTDVAPALTMMAVTKGGNHIFGHVIGATGRGLPEFKVDAFAEALAVFKEEILSDIYVGWVKGYLDDERAKLEKFIAETEATNIRISHPRDAFKAVAKALQESGNVSWLE